MRFDICLLTCTISPIREVFSGVRVTRSLVVCVCFVDRRFSFCRFSFGHRVVYPFSIHGFWLPFWYLQTLLAPIKQFRPASLFGFFDQIYQARNVIWFWYVVVFHFIIENLSPGTPASSTNKIGRHEIAENCPRWC
jgi:hypothetical protein